MRRRTIPLPVDYDPNEDGGKFAIELFLDEDPPPDTISVEPIEGRLVAIGTWNLRGGRMSSYQDVPDPPEDPLDMLEQTTDPQAVLALHEVIEIQRNALIRLMGALLETERKDAEQATLFVDMMLARPLHTDIHDIIGPPPEPPRRKLLGRGKLMLIGAWGRVLGRSGRAGLDEPERVPPPHAPPPLPPPPHQHPADRAQGLARRPGAPPPPGVAAVRLLSVLLAAAVVGCLVWALTAGASVPPFPPPSVHTWPIVICHESKIVPSTPTHGIGSTVTCRSQGVVAG